MMDAFQTGRLSRTVEVPYYERQRRALGWSAIFVGSLFSAKHGVRIYDIDLHEDWVLIENMTWAPVNMGAYCLCNEGRQSKLQFPEDVVVAPKSFLKVVCAPGRTKSLEAFEEEDGRTTLLLWKTPRGALRNEPVLSTEGDCMYLYDQNDTMVSALAKTDDGAFKEFGPLDEAREQSVWRALGLMAVTARLVCIGAAAHAALHTNLSADTTSAHPLQVVAPLVLALLLDLCQRECVLYAHVHDFLGEATSIFADRAQALALYGTLALFHGDYCGLFLAFLALDFSACWFQLFASDCGELEMKSPLALSLATKAPSVLTLICLASECFLLLLYLDHGHVQFRLYQDTGAAGLPASAFGSILSHWLWLDRPALTVPGLKDGLLLAFMLKQIMAVSQLVSCVASLVGTTFPCVGAQAGSFLEQARASRQYPNIEALRNSQSVRTLRAED